jgi:hypothetical protein
MTGTGSRLPMRVFATTAFALLAALPIASQAQPATKLQLIGLLQPINFEGHAECVASLRAW